MKGTTRHLPRCYSGSPRIVNSLFPEQEGSVGQLSVLGAAHEGQPGLFSF
jgi:hypothetical protein